MIPDERTSRDQETTFAFLSRVVGSEGNISLPTDKAAARVSESETRFFEEDGRETREIEDQARREFEEKMRVAEQNRDLRAKFSRNSRSYLEKFSIFSGVIILLQGFSPKWNVNIPELYNFHFRSNGFHIDDTPLTALIGGTAASAIGLVAIVLRGLFASTAQSDDKPPFK